MRPSERIDELEAELRGVNEDNAELYAENERLRALVAKLEAHVVSTTNARDNIQQCWNTSCAHVAEALQMLGVDTSVYGEMPDTWTLRKHCDRVMKRIAELDARRTAEEERADVVAWLRRRAFIGEHHRLAYFIDSGEHVGAAARAKESR